MKHTNGDNQNIPYFHTTGEPGPDENIIPNIGTNSTTPNLRQTVKHNRNEPSTRPLPADEYDYLKASSAQDCTGLIPSAPADQEELVHYEELYPFLPQAYYSETK